MIKNNNKIKSKILLLFYYLISNKNISPNRVKKKYFYYKTKG